MKKTSTVRVNGSMIFKGHKLTIGLDLGDRWSNYCVLNEAGEILLEQKVATTAEAMKQTFGKIRRSLIALETGTHSPWVSRLLRDLGHEVLVAHAQKVELISKSKRKDDRHDARTLARLARIDPELLGPVRHRSAKAQIHLTVIRARAELVSARTALVNAARGLAKSFGEQRGTPVSSKLVRGSLKCTGTIGIFSTAIRLIARHTSRSFTCSQPKSDDEAIRLIPCFVPGLVYSLIP